MQRLKDWTVEDLNEEQKKVHDEIVNGPRGRVVGPLRIWLNNPKLLKLHNKLERMHVMVLAWITLCQS